MFKNFAIAFNRLIDIRYKTTVKMIMLVFNGTGRLPTFSLETIIGPTQTIVVWIKARNKNEAKVTLYQFVGKYH